VQKFVISDQQQEALHPAVLPARKTAALLPHLSDQEPTANTAHKMTQDYLSMKSVSNLE